MATASQPSSGWYLDPDKPGQQRYWDGLEWTNNRRLWRSEGSYYFMRSSGYRPVIEDLTIERSFKWAGAEVLYPDLREQALKYNQQSRQKNRLVFYPLLFSGILLPLFIFFIGLIKSNDDLTFLGIALTLTLGFFLVLLY